MSSIDNESLPAPQEYGGDHSNETGLINKFFRRRSSLSSRKSEDLSQHKESLLQYLTPHKSHSRSNSSSANPCYRLSFQVGVSENKNMKYRPTMEDVHTYVANFAERLDWGYFAVFDGHAGKQTARWCGSNLHSIIEKNILKNDSVDLRVNLNNSFVESDELIREDCKGSSGSTAAVAILRWEESDLSPKHTHTMLDPLSTPFDFIPTQNHKRMLYTANVGDSRLVLCRDGRALRLSYDHKGSDLKEQERVARSGGVVLKSRVNGMLAVTRSLGDVYMKDLVIGNPYTTATEITENDEFLIIACDGLWDVCSDQRAIDLIRDVKDVSKLSKILCSYAMDNLTTDNVTVMVVRFDSGVFAYKAVKEGQEPVKDDQTTDDKQVKDEITVSNTDKIGTDDKATNDDIPVNEIDSKVKELSIE